MSLNFIKERVWNKLQGWKENLLSQAGREVLLKAVVQAIPTFAIGCFKLPSGLLNDIEMMIGNFGRANGVINARFIGRIGKLCV